MYVVSTSLNYVSFVQNYSSVVSLHPEIIDGRPGTMVIESFVVDVPEGNTKDETCFFVEALIKCNLKSLADVSERLAVQDRTEPIDRMWLEARHKGNILSPWMKLPRVRIAEALGLTGTSIFFQAVLHSKTREIFRL